jgi:membrane protease YdiL (CAAX protease family)
MNQSDNRHPSDTETSTNQASTGYYTFQSPAEDTPPATPTGPAKPTDPVGTEAIGTHRRFFSRIGLGLLALSVASNVAALLVSQLMYLLLPNATQQWWFTWVLSIIPLYGCGLPIMWLILRTLPKAPRNTVCTVRGQDVPMTSFSFGWWCVLAIVAFGYMYIGSIVGNGFMSLLSQIVGYDYQNTLQGVIGDSPLWATFLCTVVIAPCGEELLFRKLLIDRTRRYGDCVSILLSALFFALFHGNLFQFFYAFALGLVLGYLYTRTGNMGWNVSLHALINLVGGVYTSYLTSALDLEALQSGSMEAILEQFAAHPVVMLLYMLQSLLVYAFILAAIALTICLWRKVQLGRGAITLPRGRRFPTVAVNAGMILSVLTCVALLIINLIPLG